MAAYPEDLCLAGELLDELTAAGGQTDTILAQAAIFGPEADPQG